MTLADDIPDTTIWAALVRRAGNGNGDGVVGGDGDDPVLVEATAQWTAARLRQAAEEMAGRLAARGIGCRSRVMTMLPNSADHAVLLLALARLGAVWAAIAPDQRGPALAHIARTLTPDLIVAAPEAAAALAGIDAAGDCTLAFSLDGLPLADLISATAIIPPPHDACPGDVRAIVFTSGTTGPPKGAQVTERMLVASAWGAAHAADAIAGDRFLLWEPLYHIGGSQMLVLALLLPVRLYLVPRFSASRFWGQIRDHRITKAHYLGGVLEILLARPADPRDRDHGVRLAFGAGARADVWQAFEARFGISLREVYGMTEASSFTTVNRLGHVGSIGRPLPWMQVALVDEQGCDVGPGETGEIIVRPRAAGLLTPGYLGDEEASAGLLRGGALHTGDLARAGDGGDLTFVGHKKDAIRRRGEIVSAWEVETALTAHPDIAECAALAVPADIGEEDIFAVIRTLRSASKSGGSSVDLAALARWAGETLPRRSRPRYWQIVDDFPRTPSARIAKAEIPRDVADAYDADKDA